MRKKFLILCIFLLSIFFLNPSYSSATNHVTRGTDKCYKCPPLADWPAHDGTADAYQNGIPGIDGTGRYMCPDGEFSTDSACLEDQVQGAYCRYYNPNHDTVKTIIALPNSIAGQNACSGSTPVCSTTLGCIGSDRPDPAKCPARFTNGTAECKTDADCRNNGDRSCNTSYCVDSRFRPPEELRKLPDSQLEINEKGVCYKSTTVPPCPQGETCTGRTSSEDRSDPNDPLSQPCTNASVTDKDGCIRINTAIGSVSTSATGFTKWVLGFVLSLAGGIIVLIIIIAGYRIMTSSGDPEKVKNARDQITAAIVGLLFIIFSLVILELITRDILQLPGFGT